MLADRSLRLAATALAAAFTLSACGDTTRLLPSEHATPVAVPSVPSTVFPSPTQIPTATATPTGSPTATATKGGGGNTVVAGSDNRFTPATLTIKKGQKVTWTAQGAHTVTSGTDGTKDANGPMDSPLPFTSYSVTFDKAGTYKYFCVPHVSLGMVGEIVVS